MRRNVTQKISDIDGKELELTVRQACCNVLLANLKSDDKLTGEQKAKNFQLALRIVHEDEPDLSAEDVATIKRRIGEGYGPLVVGRVFEILDPVDTKGGAKGGKTKG